MAGTGKKTERQKSQKQSQDAASKPDAPRIDVSKGQLTQDEGKKEFVVSPTITGNDNKHLNATSTDPSPSAVAGTLTKKTTRGKSTRRHIGSESSEQNERGTSSSSESRHGGGLGGHGGHT